MIKLLKNVMKMLVAVIMLIAAAAGMVFVDYECSRIYGNDGELFHLFLEEKNSIWYHNYISELLR